MHAIIGALCTAGLSPNDFSQSPNRAPRLSTDSSWPNQVWEGLIFAHARTPLYTHVLSLSLSLSLSLQACHFSRFFLSFLFSFFFSFRLFFSRPSLAPQRKSVVQRLDLTAAMCKWSERFMIRLDKAQEEEEEE